MPLLMYIITDFMLLFTAFGADPLAKWNRVSRNEYTMS